MRRRLDLTIGRRLALGFVAAGLLLGLQALMSHVWTLRISNLEHHQESVIRPRAAAADHLESSTFYTAVAVRTYVLAPDDAHRQAFEASVQRVHEALQALAALPRDPDAADAFAQLPELANRYEVAARAVVDSVKEPATLTALEGTMVTAREQLMVAVQSYRNLQEAKVDQTLSSVTNAAEDMDDAELVMGGLVLTLLAVTGWLTTSSVRRPALALVSASRRLAAGDYGPALALAGDREASAELKDELAELSRTFGRMAASLKSREERLSASARLSAAMTTSLDSGRLCGAALECVADHLGAEVGAVYLHEGGALRRHASHGLGGGDEVLGMDEGIPGRAVQLRRTVVATDLPADSPFTIHLGIDRLPPRVVAAVPMVLQDDQVAGVILLASTRSLPPEAIELLEHAAAQLAVSVQNALGHQRTSALYAELREKNLKLQSQQEELQSQQEELQSQHEEIQAQNEDMQSQNEELRVQGDELRRIVQRLTSSEERTQALLSQLQDADRNKNGFLAVLSHELRNPLSPIKNSLHVLERAAPGSEQARRALVVIDRQVRQLVRLVEDLLDLTRVSRGKVQLQRAVLDLGALVRQSAEDCAAEFSSRGIELSVEAAVEASVDGDATRLAQVIGNLLHNAAKFTDRGGRVLLSLDVAGERARIRVRDTGSGMGPETLSRLFQPFMQADATLARTDGGLGLGLALVKALVEMHGGTIRATSEGHGKGSEFVVELPVVHSTAAATIIEVEPMAERHSRRVLVVEDNVDAAQSLREVLAFGGYEVEVAYNGATGIEKARTWHPDVVLCDIGLPDMEGHQVARTFRKDPALRSVFLVALTGYALPEDQKRASEAGFNQHIAKPPDIDRLEALLAGPLV